MTQEHKLETDNSEPVENSTKPPWDVSPSDEGAKAKAENDNDVVMLRRIEELMDRRGVEDDLHDCVMQVWEEKNKWRERAKSLENELDALIAISKRFGYIKVGW